MKSSLIIVDWISPEIPEDSIEAAGRHNPALLSAALSHPGELALSQGLVTLHAHSEPDIRP